MKKLLIASHNQGKVEEIGRMIAPYSISVISATDANLDEPEETGTTFTANAKLKARHAMEHSGLPSLADDSGLCVDALNDAPGVYSARWGGPNKDWPSAFKRIERELAGKKPNAHFMCALCLCLPGGETHFFEGRIDGTLTFTPRGSKGFGYDPIFIPNGYDQTFAEMSSEEKNRISHRALAFKKFVEFIGQHHLY